MRFYTLGARRPLSINRLEVRNCAAEALELQAYICSERGVSVGQVQKVNRSHARSYTYLHDSRVFFAFLQDQSVTVSTRSRCVLSLPTQTSCTHVLTLHAASFLGFSLELTQNRVLCRFFVILLFGTHAHMHTHTHTIYTRA